MLTRLHQELFTLAYRLHEGELELFDGFPAAVQAVDRGWPQRAAIGFDIGAGTGPYARKMLDCCDEVVLVEPNREQAAYLRRAFGSRPHVVEAAAGNAPGASFLVDAAPGGWRRPLARLAPDAKPGEGWQQPCRVETVDAMADALGLLSRSGAVIGKIDVEGEELSVLEGMPRLLADRQALLIVEIDGRLNPAYKDAFAWLAREGFTCLAYEGGRLVPGGPEDVARMAGRSPGRFARLKGYRSNFVFLR